MDMPLPQPPGDLVPQNPEYRDRSTGLVVFGIIEIVVGLFAALGIPFLLIGIVVSRKAMGGALPWGNYVVSIVSYGFIAAAMITLGIGCIRAQRWARDLTLVVSWIWLVVGVLITISMTVALPTAFAAGFKAAQASNPNAGPVSPAIMAVVLTFVIAFMAVFAIVLPIIFLFFFRREDVQETCRRRDPVPRWTEHCPLPVLALSLLFALGAGYYLLLSVTVPMMPFWGRYLVGIPGGIACFLLAGLEVYLAIAFFRLWMIGWWIAVFALAIRLASTAVTIRYGNLMQAYARMGWSQQQLQALQANPMMRSGVMLWAAVPIALLFFGYLLWTHRYFVRTVQSIPTAPETSFPVQGI